MPKIVPFSSHQPVGSEKTAVANPSAPLPTGASFQSGRAVFGDDQMVDSRSSSATVLAATHSANNTLGYWQQRSADRQHYFSGAKEDFKELKGYAINMLTARPVDQLIGGKESARTLGGYIANIVVGAVLSVVVGVSVAKNTFKALVFSVFASSRNNA